MSSHHPLSDTVSLLALNPITGTTGSERLVGTTGADEIHGLDGEDTIDGGAGSDLFVAGPGNDAVIGGDGRDVAVFSGSSGDYRFSIDYQGAVVVQDLRSSGATDGVDRLAAVEVMRFADRDVEVPFGGAQAANSTPIIEMYEWSMDTAPLDDGGFVVAWSARTNAVHLYPQVFVRIYDADGQPRGAQSAVADLGRPGQVVAGGGEYAAPTVTPLEGGRLLVAWGLPTEDGYALMARIVGTDGVPTGEVFLVDQPAGCYSSFADAATLADGSVVIAWEVRETGLNGFFRAQVLARRYDADGEPLGGVIELSDGYVQGQEIYPAVAALADGGYAATWHQHFGEEAGYDVVLRVVDAQGAQSPLYRLNEQQEGDQKFPDVAGLADGGLVAGWQSASGFNGNVFARIVDADGVALGDEFRVNATADMPRFGVSLAALAGGDIAVTWSAGDLVSGIETHGRILSANGTLPGEEFTALAVGILGSGSGKLAPLANGDFGLAALVDGSSVAVHRFGADGTPYARVFRGTRGDDRIDIAGDSPLEIGAAGGLGDDTYVVRHARSSLFERADAGIDTVEAMTHWTLATHFENLLLADGVFYINGTGNAASNRITGNASGNTLDGLAGDDTLDGGGGSDTASYATAPSAVTVDLARAGAQDTGGAGADVLVSIENVAGSRWDDRLGGNGDTNVIDGGGGADTLSGGGGFDSIRGGEGDDVAVFPGAHADYWFERHGSGPLVFFADSSGAVTLTEVERLVFADREFRYDAARDLLVASALADRLDLGSWAQLGVAGGAGDDTYVIYRADARFRERADEGTDTVEVRPDTGHVVPGSFSRYTLGAHVENLEILGTSAFDATGNNLPNAIVGNAGENVLEGLGGADTLDGGDGVDTASYARSTSAVTVSLSIAGAQATGGAGRDTLIAIENLVGSLYGDRLTGDAGANRLQGGNGNDTLAGGSGDDWLEGGAGVDTAMFAASSARYGLGWDAESATFVVGNTADGSTAHLGTIEVLAFTDASLGLRSAGRNLVSAEQVRACEFTALADGGFVATWSAVDAEGFGVFVQRLDADCRSIGLPSRVSATGAGAQDYPSVAALAGGRFVVAWDVSTPDGAESGIWFRVYAADGRALGPDTRGLVVHATQTSSLVAAPDGGFLLVSTSVAGLVIRRFDADGNAGGPALRLDAAGATAPDLAPLADGGFVMCWHTESARFERNVQAQRLDAQGAPIGSPVDVNDVPNYSGSPAVAALADGGWVISWTATNQGDGAGSGVLASVFNADGTLRRSNFRVNDFTNGNQHTADVLPLEDGGFLVAWESDYSIGAWNWSVIARRFGSDGAPAGTEFVLADDAARLPAIAAADGGFALLWSGREGLTAQRFDPSGNDMTSSVVGSDAADRIDISGDGDLAAIGGRGNDVYVVNSAGDRPVEHAGEGIDRVEALIDWTLGADFEQLLLLDGGSALAGTGNASANRIVGNDADNLLRGLGGADVLAGGNGRDTLIGGAGKDDLAGGEGSDLLKGGGGADRLSGGAGADTLQGGAGGDAFRFGLAPDAAGRDLVVDFRSGMDRIELDRGAFPGLGAAGPLDPARFASGAGLAGGVDADDRIVFDTGSGALYYDADGSGAGPAIRFAVLETGRLLASDIVLVG